MNDIGYFFKAQISTKEGIQGAPLLKRRSIE